MILGPVYGLFEFQFVGSPDLEPARLLSETFSLVVWFHRRMDDVI